MSDIMTSTTTAMAAVTTPTKSKSSLLSSFSFGTPSSKDSIDKKTSSSSWLLRFFESKHFDMSIAISYLFNTKEPGVQTYLCNRLFTFDNKDVDFYLPQLLNIYIYCCNDNNEQLIADMLNAYFRTRCSCRKSGIDFSLRCSWLLDAHINDNAKLASRTKESRVRRGLNNAIKLYKLIISEKLRPSPSLNETSNNNNNNYTSNYSNNNNNNNNSNKSNENGLNNHNYHHKNIGNLDKIVMKMPVKEESSVDFDNNNESNSKFKDEYISFNLKEYVFL